MQEDCSLRLRSSLGVLNKEKSLHPPAASVGSFCFYPSHEQAQLGLNTKIPGPVRRDQGFFFVAEAGEISNLELVEDLFKILEIIESVNSVY
jgi:hypothetical protein